MASSAPDIELMFPVRLWNCQENIHQLRKWWPWVFLIRSVEDCFIDKCLDGCTQNSTRKSNYLETGFPSCLVESHARAERSNLSWKNFSYQFFRIKTSKVNSLKILLYTENGHPLKYYPHFTNEHLKSELSTGYAFQTRAFVLKLCFSTMNV